MEKFDFNLPGLGRAKSSRPDRVAEAIMQEISLLLVQQVRDSRLHGVSISKVQLAPDLKQAKVWFMVSKGADPARARKGMEKARGFFRSHIAKTLNLRYTPELIFFYDKQNEAIEHLEQIFSLINKEKKERPAEEEHGE
jgi:ribosome-binding factor A